MGAKSKEKVIGESVLNRLKDLEQNNEYLRKRQRDYEALKAENIWLKKYSKEKY